MLTKRTKIDGLGEVGESSGNMLTNVRELGELISVRDEAYARIHSDIGRTYGIRVSMVVSYLKGEAPVFVKNGMTAELARYLLCASPNFLDTHSSKQYETVRTVAEREEKSGVEPAKRRAMICPSRGNFSMSPMENLAHLEFVLEDLTKSYFEKNSKRPVTFYPIDASIVDSAKGTILNYIWFAGLDHRSTLYGNGNAVNVGCRTRGVLKRD